MQTFLPFRSFKRSAHILDDQRLNKQITEAFQILDSLKMYNPDGSLKPKYERKFKDKKKPAWLHHPANLMWIGHYNTLKYYISCFHYEWVNVRGKNYERLAPDYITPVVYPPWFCKTFRKSHRSQLVRKRPDLYGDVFSNVPELCYYWPFTWSPVFGRRIQVPPRVYKKIGHLPKKDFDKAYGVIKKHGIKGIINE